LSFPIAAVYENIVFPDDTQHNSPV